MDTISHGAWAYLLVHNNANRWSFLAGAVFPDIGLIGITIVSMLSGHLKIFSPWLLQLYYLPFPPKLDSAMHSLVLWTAAYAAVMLYNLRSAWWFINGIYLHLGIDILTHKHYLPKYLWPVSSFNVFGLIDYRTMVFTIMDILLLAGFSFLLYYYKKNRSKKITP